MFSGVSWEWLHLPWHDVLASLSSLLLPVWLILDKPEYLRLL